MWRHLKHISRPLTRVLATPALQPKETEIALEQWLRKHGMQNNGVRIAESTISNRGLFATRDFIQGETPLHQPQHKLPIPTTVCFEGETLLQLPMDLAAMVYPDDEEQKIAVNDNEMPDTVIRLAAKLLRKRATSSELQAYLDALPSLFVYPSFVYRQTPSNDIYHREMGIIVKYYESIVRYLTQLELDGVGEWDIRWALAMIQSRSFGNGMGQEMMIPFIDIMNHGDIITNDLFSEHPKANITYGWHRQGDGPKNWSMVIKAKQTILENEEIFVSYGDHSNEFFLLYYGFVPLYNPRDEFVLFHNLDDVLEWYFLKRPEERRNIDDAGMERLKKRIRIEGDMAEVVKLNLCADGSISPILYQFVLFLCRESEADAVNMIAIACAERLSTSTPILDDLRLLQVNAPSDTIYYHYQYETVKKEISDCYRGREMPLWAQETNEMRAIAYGSIEWWIVVHSALKKRILCDYITEEEGLM